MSVASGRWQISHGFSRGRRKLDRIPQLSKKGKSGIYMMTLTTWNVVFLFTFGIITFHILCLVLKIFLDNDKISDFLKVHDMKTQSLLIAAPFVFTVGLDSRVERVKKASDVVLKGVDSVEKVQIHDAHTGRLNSHANPTKVNSRNVTTPNWKVISVRFGSQAAPAIAIPDKKAAKPADDNDDDDDINFFGKETEKKKKEIETREVAKASTKKKESGKLFILMDIKPWDDKTDIRNLRKLFAVLRWKVFSGEHPNWSQLTTGLRKIDHACHH
ncbi:Elongation factor 1-delta [Capsicum annuum]|nr:Elongation factor 1-delta [Capsicum annuum]